MILLFAQNSFLARHVATALPKAAWRGASHGDIDDPGLLDGIEVVLSFAKPPAIGQGSYDLGDDPDLRLVARIGDRPVRFVMLSSRKAYQPATIPLAEDAALGPADAYGRNKLALEQRLGSQLGDRLTILRLANIFGYERGRRTFLGLLLDRLANEGAIRFDMSPFVGRDFLPVERFAGIVARIARHPPGGVLNVGSGIALPTGRLALWILEGFGRGRLVIESPREHDAFVLDVRRLTDRYGPPCNQDALRAACLAIGRRLADETQA